MGQIAVAAPGEQDPVASHPVDGQGLRERLAALEKQMILHALDAARWHRGRAAEALQLNYKTLQRRMKAHGIK